MDRLFVLQREWTESKDFPDPPALARLLDWSCPRSLDRWDVMSFGDEPAREIGGFKAVPIGTIQFVSHWLETLGAADPQMTPLEVPTRLRPFLRREYFLSKGKDIPPECLDGSKWFIKDANHLKRWNSFLYDDRDLGYFIEPETTYVVSEKIAIASEHRVFVLDDEVVGVEHYLGDPLAFPDGRAISDMVSCYAKGPRLRAYTLDVAARADGSTEPLEVHPFACCGLYGFSGRELPDMYEAGWDWYLSEYSEEAR